MSPKLSTATQQRVEAMYPVETRDEVVGILVDECGSNIPPFELDEDEFAYERLRFAALKVSNGDVGMLKKAVALAKQDYRELLGAAGFAWSTTAHRKWTPNGMGPQTEGWWARRRVKRFLSQD